MARSGEPAAAPRVAMAIDDAHAARDVADVLAARGLVGEPTPLDRAIERARGDDRDRDPAGARVIAYAPEQLPTPARAHRLAALCQASAEAGRPLVMLGAFAMPVGTAAQRAACAVAFLRSHGAIICADPDTWIETICLIAGHGLPDGPRAAIVAPPGSWLAASAVALTNEAELLGDRVPDVAPSTSQLDPTDVALVDRSALSPSTPERVGQARVVPVVGRAELLDDAEKFPLVGLRAAIAAVASAGGLAERLDIGLGPDGSPRDDPALLDQLGPELDRFDRQIEKLDTRAGDHETKVLLSSWQIPVTRQAVATTPSAATRVAKKAGYPVEVKPWGPDQLSERDGCPVQRGLDTASDVRRAVETVTRAAGLPPDAPVIVRETPPAGRDVYAHVTRVDELGWMVVMEVDGSSEPLAAPAPLRPVDAAALVSRVEATRATDPALDRDALADILVRASHLAVYHEDVIEALYLHRIVVTRVTEKTVVADAQAVLRPRG